MALHMERWPHTHGFTRTCMVHVVRLNCEMELLSFSNIDTGDVTRWGGCLLLTVTQKLVMPANSN